MSDSVLKLENLTRRFRQGNSTLSVLDGVFFEMKKGDFTALVAPSGAGKSTFLQIAGLLENPDQGKITIAGRQASNRSDAVRTQMRRDHIGFIYQFHHLLGEFSALENVALPQQIAGIGTNQAQTRARQLLERVGLGSRLHHRPATLSGGEQQRVAIARALANEPDLLLADEPTGNLDPKNAETIFELLSELVRERQMAALIATHNLVLSQAMKSAITLHQRKIVPARLVAAS